MGLIDCSIHLRRYDHAEVLNVRKKVDKRSEKCYSSSEKTKQKIKIMVKQLRQLIKPLLKLLPQNDYPVLDSQLFVLIWMHFILDARVSTMYE
jgi:hypothetical protein